MTQEKWNTVLQGHVLSTAKALFVVTKVSIRGDNVPNTLFIQKLNDPKATVFGTADFNKYEIETFADHVEEIVQDKPLKAPAERKPQPLKFVQMLSHNGTLHALSDCGKVFYEGRGKWVELFSEGETP